MKMLPKRTLTGTFGMCSALLVLAFLLLTEVEGSSGVMEKVLPEPYIIFM